MKPLDPVPDGAVGAPASLYVHAPFCVRRCRYCDFAVHVSRSGDLEGWLKAVSTELRLLQEAGEVPASLRLDTLYVGGGTPSLLGPAAMARLLEDLSGMAVLVDGAEFTAEANPESFTPEVASAWKGAGLGRLSLGVQSFHEPTLRWMGRLHGSEGATEAVQIARDAGFSNLSLDLIFGLPERLGRDWEADLERAVALEAPHVSLYGLTVEGSTPLGRAVAAGTEPPVDDAQYEREFLIAACRLREAGYRQYEVSNFAIPGFESRHNRVYWSGRPYVGLGNGAHSFLPPRRSWNLRDWQEYRKSLESGVLPRSGSEVVEGEAALLEGLWLALRTDRGLDPAELAPEGGALLSEWKDRGLAEHHGERMRLTPRGWLLLDRLTVDLDAALTAGR